MHWNEHVFIDCTYRLHADETIQMQEIHAIANQILGSSIQTPRTPTPQLLSTNSSQRTILRIGHVLRPAVSTHIKDFAGVSLMPARRSSLTGRFCASQQTGVMTGAHVNVTLDSLANAPRLLTCPQVSSELSVLRCESEANGFEFATSTLSPCP